MPIETIKCQECGSAGVTEFKPGSYVCGHCEAVFKHVQPSKPAIELCSCGTFAIGHCHECGTPVCNTHSALWHDQRRLCTADWPERRAVGAPDPERSRIAQKLVAEREDRARQELLSLQSRADELVKLLTARRAAGSEQLRGLSPTPKRKFPAWKVYEWDHEYRRDHLMRKERQTFYLDADLRLIKMYNDGWLSLADRDEPLYDSTRAAATPNLWGFLGVEKDSNLAPIAFWRAAVSTLETLAAKLGVLR